MMAKLELAGDEASRSITDVFQQTVSVNVRIVEKTLQNAIRTPWVMYAMLPLSRAVEVWENNENDKGEQRRYYLTPFRSDDPDESGIVAVSAKDDHTGEEVVFNVVPMTASYANNLRKGNLLFISYPEEALCHHGCCADNVNGLAERSKLAVTIRQKDEQIQKMRVSVRGLQQEVGGLKESRQRQKATLTQMQTLMGALLADFQPAEQEPPDP
jgi:hypothetical protein